jgi:K+-sensing histidine kinase KdpD
MCVTLLFQASSFKNILPLAFLSLILIVALRFGSTAGILGTFTAALIFASFLFDPRLNPRVADLAARGNLIWMVILGIWISALTGWTKPDLHPR